MSINRIIVIKCIVKNNRLIPIETNIDNVEPEDFYCKNINLKDLKNKEIYDNEKRNS